MYGFSSDRWRTMHWTRQIRFKAYYAVSLAVSRGEIPKITSSDKCVDCGDTATCYEHRNYFYPLSVDLVCKTCDQRRGPGWPPPEGPAIDDNGVSFQAGKAWSNLEAGSNKVKVGIKSANLETRTSEWDERDNLFNQGMPIYRRAAFDELYGVQARYSKLSRGDLRADYFKRHDPYYICEDVA